MVEFRKSQYLSLREWAKAFPSAYNAINDKGLMGKMCKTFNWKISNNRRMLWTKEKCIEYAKKYKTKIRMATHFSIFTQINL